MLSDRKKIGYLEGVVSITLNAVFFVLKYFYGVLFNSIALIADSIHTLSDSLTSMVVILGFWITYKPIDKEHPFGHGRAEYIATIIIGAMLVMVGIDFIQRSYTKLISREPFVFSWALVAVLGASAIAKEALALWAFKLGKKYRASSITADAWHHRSDAIASALLAIAITFGSNLWWLDSVLGFVVSTLIIYTGIEIMYEKTFELLGRAPTLEEIEKIKKIAYNVSPLVQDLHHIHIHEYGGHTEVTLHIRLPPETSVSTAHKIASDIEKIIKDALKWEATVHIEPYIPAQDTISTK
ncbi:MAG: cation diffusion facilitator family transporter [Ignisphaera sp.]